MASEREEALSVRTPSAKKDHARDSAVQTVFTVSGMHCNSCVDSIKNSLEALNGIFESHIEVGEADVVHDPKILSTEELKNAIEDAGFEVVAMTWKKLSVQGGDTCTESFPDDSDACPLSGRGAGMPGPDTEGVRRVDFRVGGMSCASCVGKIESQMKKMPGVVNVSVNLLAENATVMYDPSKETPVSLQKVIGNLGFTAEIEEAAQGEGNATILVEGMTCASCVAKIQRTLEHMQGVKSVSLNLLSGNAQVEFDPNRVTLRTLMSTIEGLGYKASLPEKTDSVVTDALLKKKEIHKYLRLFLGCVVFAIVTLVVMIGGWIPVVKEGVHFTLYRALTVGSLASWILSTPVVFFFGRGILWGGFKAIRHRSADMNVLLTIGILAAYVYSVLSILYSFFDENFKGAVFFDAGVFLVTFVMLGRLLENFAKGKTSSAIQKLMSLQAPTALLLDFDPDTGEVLSEREVDTRIVEVGDILKVVPGGQIPADGTIVFGTTTVDESMITGESLPVTKVGGDEVVGGSLNVEGMVHLRTTRIGSETTLAKIAQYVLQAQTSKAPIQEFAVKVSRYFVPAVVSISAVTFVTWMILGFSGALPDDWNENGGGNWVSFSLLFAIAVLVIGCPCALGLATPTAVMVGTGLGAKHGVLIKGGSALEKARGIGAIVFDKTGTLTHGKPVVTDHLLWDEGLTELELFELAGSAESGSEHPLATAVVAHAQTLGVKLSQPTAFNAVPGKGLRCVVDGVDTLIGNRMWMEDNSCAPSKEQSTELEALEAVGKTAMLVSSRGRLIGAIAVADTIKEEARVTVERLQRSMEVWMVTGDNERTARAIASQLNITNVFAGVLPEQKAEKVKQLQQRTRRTRFRRRRQNMKVAMVGDGINDSPALAQADIGIAIGGGTDVAIETADVVLMKSDLWDVVRAFAITSQTYWRIRINFIWAFVYNMIGIPLAAGVFFPLLKVGLPPPVAAGAMAMSSVSVVTSSLSLRFYCPPSPGENRRARFARQYHLDGRNHREEDVNGVRST